MANRRIIDLPEAGTITDGDYYHVSQSGIDKRVPHSTLVGVLSADLVDKIDAVEALVNEATLASNTAISAKDLAVTSAGAAQDSETAAEMSEANASSSELNAADSELMSQKWAANPENVVVEGGLYSSRHYMSKAATSASISQGVEQTVLTAQTDVQQNAAKALTSENNSAASASSSAASATSADASATAATASQNKAKDWASKPKGQEVETGLYSALHYADNARLDAVATDADRTQTSQFANTSSQNAVQTAADVIATAADRVATGLDRVATGQDRVQTGQDAVATAADRVVTTQDRAATLTNRNAAAASSTLANKWAENPENEAVESNRYSALHHAAKALASQNLAQTAATTSTTQAGLSETARVASVAARDAAISARNTAQAAQTATEQVYDQFDDRYLGSKTFDPTTDNDGGALLTGALYYRTTSPIGMRVWDGSVWDMAYVSIEDIDGGAY